MKSILGLFVFILCSSVFGQSQNQVLDNLANDVCKCLENTDEKKLKSNLKTATTNCIQKGLDQNMDALLEAYGNGFLEGGEIANSLSRDVNSRLNADCNAFKNYLSTSEIKDVGNTAQQSAFIDELAEWACRCSEEKLTADPNQIFQDVLESCLQSAVMENTEKLTNAFGNSVLTDLNMANTIRVDVGKKIVTECEVFTKGISAPLAPVVQPLIEHDLKTFADPILVAVQKTKTLGKVISFSKEGDFLSLTLQSEDGEENNYYIGKAFAGSDEFIDSLKKLKKNETKLTLFYTLKELYFKSENVNKNVFRIETVEY